MENKDLQHVDIVDINKWKKLNERKQANIRERNKIAKERKERIQKAKMNRLIKRFVFAGVLSLSLGANALHVRNAFQERQAQNEAFQPLSEDALKIFQEGIDYRQNKNTGYVEPQYDHYEMAKNIENYAQEHGKLKGDAILATVLNMATENAYHNDSRIINALSDDYTTAKSIDEFLAMEGYESKEEFLQSIKEQIYEEAKKEEVRENYLSNEGGLKK